MDDEFANAIIDLNEGVDRAVHEVLDRLSHKEIADELRVIAQGWEDAA